MLGCLDDKVYKRCTAALAEWGVRDIHAAMILYGMVTAHVSYNESLRIYADYRDVPPEWMHNQLCYRLLSAGVCVRPGTLLEYLRWKENEHEDRVSAGQGSRPDPVGTD